MLVIVTCKKREKVILVSSQLIEAVADNLIWIDSVQVSRLEDLSEFENPRFYVLRLIFGVWTLLLRYRRSTDIIWHHPDE